MFKKRDSAALRAEYDREILRSAFSSMFWAVISDKKKSGLSLTSLAASLGVHKSAVSRWFSGTSPNWEINTISDIANALDVEIKITAIDRQTGAVFTSSGAAASQASASIQRIETSGRPGTIAAPISRGSKITLQAA